MSILIFGLGGILILFPVGLHATKQAIESSNAAILAESVYASLRAAVQQVEPVEDSKIKFFHDGIALTFSVDRPATGKSVCIPGPIVIPGTTDAIPGPIDPNNIILKFAQIGTGYSEKPGEETPILNITVSEKDPGLLKQYFFNIEIFYPDVDPEIGLYDIIIRIRRNKKLIHKTVSKLLIPTPL